MKKLLKRSDGPLELVTIKVPDTVARLIRLLATLADKTMGDVVVETVTPALTRKIAAYGVNVEKWLGKHGVELPATPFDDAEATNATTDVTATS